jgi:uncharacterized coiled-coil DUF342 family protein
MKGSLTMERVKETRPIIHKYFDVLLEKIAHLEEETSELKKLAKSLATQRDNAINQFDQLIIEKQMLESELYSRVQSIHFQLQVFTFHFQIQCHDIFLFQMKVCRVIE